MAVEKVKFEPDWCIACKMCVDECPEDALILITAFVEGEVNAEQVSVELDKCVGEDECGLCVGVCPTLALYFYPSEPEFDEGDGGNDEPPEPPPDDKIKYKNMSDALRNRIKQTLDNLVPCPRSKLLDKLKDGDRDIVFEQDSSAEPLGHYSVTKKSLVFAENSVIGNELLSHELFHAYQDQHYANMGQYAGNNPGKVNIEFEQYVFQSISLRMDGRASVVGKDFDGNSAVRANFKDWIDALTNDGSTMPDLSNHPDFMDYYNEFLDRYNEYGPIPYRSPTVDLHPQTLYNLFDGEGC